MSIFNLPDLGEGLPDAEIIKWLVSVGDYIELDQPLAEMETAKAVVEVPAPQKGRILKLHGNPGDIIKTGSPLVSFENNEAQITENNHSDTPVSTSINTGKQPNAFSVNKTFYLPDLGEGLQEAEIVDWKIQSGDHISTDQIIASMETAKAVVDLPSPFSGTIGKLHGKPGDIIKTGSPLFEMHTTLDNTEVDSKSNTSSGNVVGDLQTSNSTVEETRTFSDGINATPAVRAVARKLNIDLQQVLPSDKTSSISLNDLHSHIQSASSMPYHNRTTPKIGPAARNLAIKLGVNTNLLNGTGPKDCITPQDIKLAANHQSNNAPVPAGYPLIKAAPKIRATAKQLNIDLNQVQASGHLGNITLHDLFNHQRTTQASPALSLQALNVDGLNVVTTPIRGTRRAMYTSMSHARDHVVNTSIFDDANISSWTAKQDITMRFVRAIISACKFEPKLNAWLDDAQQTIILHNDINLGIAVDSKNGLYVPVIKSANCKSTAEIRTELNSHREAINSRAIKPEHLQNGSITLSNFGMIAGRYATPIVIPPQVAIIGTGGFYDVLSLTDKKEVTNQRHIPLSLSFDHRAVTGGEAARFLMALIKDLQKPD